MSGVATKLCWPGLQIDVREREMWNVRSHVHVQIDDVIIYV